MACELQYSVPESNGPEHIVIVTDAWHPQVNGVVRTLEMTAKELRSQGYRVSFITPEPFLSMRCPTYPEIRLSLVGSGRMGAMIRALAPDYLHISTEGPLGLAARAYCVRNHKAFTTAFHTKFPDYIHARTGIPVSWTYRYIRWFHGAAQSVMCATPSIAAELEQFGIPHTRHWSRGVDVSLFNPARRLKSPVFANLPRPIHLYVGRVAIEKNIEDFLALDVPGSKVVVGDGPQRTALQAKYPDVVFTGPLYGDALADCYASADVFVFPSRTDTFGLVLLEALASGTPVAAYPAPGPIDVIGSAPVGILDRDLAGAVRAARGLSRAGCRAFALDFTWAACADQFLSNLAALAPRATKLVPGEALTLGAGVISRPESPSTHLSA